MADTLNLRELVSYFEHRNFSESDTLHYALIGQFGVYVNAETSVHADGQQLEQFNAVDDIHKLYESFVVDGQDECELSRKEITKSDLIFKQTEVQNFENELLKYKDELEKIELISTIVCPWLAYAINNDNACRKEIENIKNGVISLRAFLCLIVTFSCFEKRMHFKSDMDAMIALKIKKATGSELEEYGKNIQESLSKLEREETDNYIFLIKKAQMDVLNNRLILRLSPSFVPMNDMPNIKSWCVRSLPALHDSLESIEPQISWVIYLDDAWQWIKNNKLHLNLLSPTKEARYQIASNIDALLGGCIEMRSLNRRQNVLYSSLLNFMSFFAEYLLEEETIEAVSKVACPYLTIQDAINQLGCTREHIVRCAMNDSAIRIFVKIDGEKCKLFITAGNSACYGIMQTIASRTGKSDEIIKKLRALPIFELENKEKLCELLIKGEIYFDYLLPLKLSAEAKIYGVNVGARPPGSGTGKITLEDVFIHEHDVGKISKCITGSGLLIPVSAAVENSAGKVKEQGQLLNSDLAQIEGDNEIRCKAALSDSYVFHKNGDSWNIRFREIEINIKDLHGLHYINKLLHAPNTSIIASDLIKITRKLSGEVISSSVSTSVAKQHLGLEPESELENDETVPIDDQALLAHTDNKTIKECKEKIEDLEDRITEADKNGELEKKERFQEEKNKYKQYLASTTNIKGIPRQNTTLEKNRKSVEKAISKALTAIKEYCIKHKISSTSTLSDHLKDCIKTGNECIYLPKDPIIWN